MWQDIGGSDSQESSKVHRGRICPVDPDATCETAATERTSGLG